MRLGLEFGRVDLAIVVGTQPIDPRLFRAGVVLGADLDDLADVREPVAPVRERAISAELAGQRESHLVAASACHPTNRTGAVYGDSSWRIPASSASTRPSCIHKRISPTTVRRSASERSMSPPCASASQIFARTGSVDPRELIRSSSCLSAFTEGSRHPVFVLKRRVSATRRVLPKLKRAVIARLLTAAAVADYLGLSAATVLDLRLVGDCRSRARRWGRAGTAFLDGRGTRSSTDRRPAHRSFRGSSDFGFTQ